jgi:nucleoside-diphosphate-sugar epimerase
MRIFITGASGYVGGSVAARLVAEGHQVLGLVRSAEKGALLRARGVEPVLGTLNDRAILVEAARRSDAVINAADSDHPYVVEAILPALEGSGKCFIQTSGSSIIADRAAGEPSARTFHEDSVFEPLPERLLRIAIDRLVLAAAHRGVRSVVLRPALIYGRGRGLNPNSVQVPKLIGLARQSGIARHVGRGLNVWSHLHIDDVVELYLRALAEAPAGSLFYAENGEASMKDVAAAIGRLLGLGAATREWPIEEALASWGPSAYTSYGSNSRVSGLKARRLLGWAPKGPRLLDDIEHGSYRETPASG